MSTLAPHLDLSVVVPAYNETARIAPTLQKLHAFLETQDSRYEIIVVDDGSSDGTAEHVERLAIPHVRVIRSRPNRGKGAAVRTGMLDARGLVRVMCDADGSMPPDELPKLLARLATGEYEIAIGSRYAPGAAANTSQPKWRVWWSRLCNKVIQRSLVPGVTDTQCGFKAFTAHAARDLFGRARINGWAFDLEVLALARRRGWAIAEVGVSWTDDRRSRVNPLKDMWKVVREALTIRKNLRTGVYELPAGAEPAIS